MEATRESLIERLSRVGLDWGDEEDAERLVDVLLEGYDPLEVQTWLYFYDCELDETPLVALQEGRARDVMRRACTLVREVSS